MSPSKKRKRRGNVQIEEGNKGGKTVKIKPTRTGGSRH